MTACTVITRPHVASARVLHDSFLRHHPTARFVTLLLDADEGSSPVAGLGEVVSPLEIGLTEREWHDLAACHVGRYLAAALTAPLLAHVVTNDGPALFLDPDTEVHARLDDVFESAEQRGIVLTPVVLTLKPDRTQAGLFDAGVVAVGEKGLPFLRWWHKRIRRDAGTTEPREAPISPLDRVPALFDCAILRDPTLNVGHHNLHERRLTRNPAGQFLVDGQQLRLFRYDGWDPDRPWLLSAHAMPNSATLMSANPPLVELTEKYSARLRAAGSDAATGAGQRWTHSGDGLVLTPDLRRPSPA